jgi:S1-C subfamily serine protease
VEGVQDNTPAAKGGLKGGEVVTEIDGKPVKDVTDFRFRIADYPPRIRSHTHRADGEEIQEDDLQIG